MIRGRFVLLSLIVVCIAECTSVGAGKEHEEEGSSTTKVSKDNTEEPIKEECRDRAKWCPCMVEDCHKRKVAKKCPKTCRSCINDEDKEKRPGFSSWGEEGDKEEEEGDEEWGEIEDSETEEWDKIEEDADRPDVYLYDCRNPINMLDCRCLETILHKKFLCYHQGTPPYGKYDSSKAAQYHHYCYLLGHEKERGRKQCCRAAQSFKEIRGC
ncbi:uncharacterized protein LOC134811049 [Bolinopsis microptera]|uniref:uncharacterized protein LOC134811049 n=1 Tax=Bolinopsis microptera TaxID=2820187 RepID=UPI0030794AF3